MVPLMLKRSANPLAIFRLVVQLKPRKSAPVEVPSEVPVVATHWQNGGISTNYGNPLSSTDKGFRVIGSLFRIQPLVDHPTDAIARKPNKTAACIPASGRNHQISRGVAPRIATSCGPRSAWPARHESAAAAGRSALRQTALQRPFPRLPSARQAWSWQAALRSCRGTC